MQENMQTRIVIYVYGVRTLAWWDGEVSKGVGLVLGVGREAGGMVRVDAVPAINTPRDVTRHVILPQYSTALNYFGQFFIFLHQLFTIIYYY